MIDQVSQLLETLLFCQFDNASLTVAECRNCIWNFVWTFLWFDPMVFLQCFISLWWVKLLLLCLTFLNNQNEPLLPKIIGATDRQLLYSILEMNVLLIAVSCLQLHVRCLFVI